MPMQNYLSSVILALRQLQDEMEDEQARAVIDHCICTLAGLTNVADVSAEAGNLAELLATLPGAPDPDGSAKTDPALLTAPPESLAATPTTAALIERGAQWIDREDWTGDPDRETSVKNLVREEHALIDAALRRVLALEQYRPAADDGDFGAGVQIVSDDVSRFFQREDLPISKGELISFRQVFGGRSRQTALLSVRHADGGQGNYAIQRDNPIAGKPQSVIGEFPLLEHLFANGLKVPRPILAEPNAEWLGAPFMVVEQVAGTVAERDYFGAPSSRQLVEQFAAELAKLHALKVEDSLGLQSTLSEPGLAGWRAELGMIAEAWHAEKNWPSIAVSAALGWMTQHVGELELASTLVHGDPAFHNVLCDGDVMTALLDWELAHIGHPAEDLGYCRGAVSQIVPWAEFVALYQQAGGRRFSPVTLDYFSLRAIVNIMRLIQNIRTNIECGDTLDVGVADLGASFIPKLTHRLSKVLVEVLGD